MCFLFPFFLLWFLASVSSFCANHLYHAGEFYNFYNNLVLHSFRLLFFFCSSSSFHFFATHSNPLFIARDPSQKGKILSWHSRTYKFRFCFINFFLLFRSLPTEYYTNIIHKLVYISHKWREKNKNFFATCNTFHLLFS